MTDDILKFLQRSGFNAETRDVALLATVDKINLSTKSKDFKHLLFNKNNISKVLRFREFVETL